MSTEEHEILGRHLLLKKTKNPQDGADEAYGIGIVGGTSYIGSIAHIPDLGWRYSVVDPAQKLPMPRRADQFAVCGFFDSKADALHNLVKAHELAGG